MSHVSLAIGTAEKTTSPDHTRVINHTAAETWGDGLKLIEHGADYLRHQSYGESEPVPRDVCGTSFVPWLVSVERQFNSTLHMVRAVQPEQQPPATHTANPAGKANDGVKRPGSINDHFSDWLAVFPGVCAFSFLNQRGCQKGTSCPHANSHDQPIPDQAKLDKFKAEHGFK